MVRFFFVNVYSKRLLYHLLVSVPMEQAHRNGTQQREQPCNIVVPPRCHAEQIVLSRAEEQSRPTVGVLFHRLDIVKLSAQHAGNADP